MTIKRVYTEILSMRRVIAINDLLYTAVNIYVCVLTMYSSVRVYVYLQMAL